MSSIPYNPVFFSYAVVTPTTATLYIDEKQNSKELQDHLSKHVQIRPYGPILEDLITLSKETVDAEDAKPKKFLFPSNSSWALAKAIGEKRLEDTRSPVTLAKAIKNETELQGMRACHIRDGAALIQYFAWLEDELVNKSTKMDEVDAADKLESYRK